jgi:hypothetical protein
LSSLIAVWIVSMRDLSLDDSVFILVRFYATDA